MKAWVERVAKVMTPFPPSTRLSNSTWERKADSPWVVCCIYHAPKPIDESSDESSSDDSSSDNDSGDDGSARPVGGREGGGRGNGHDCVHDHGSRKGKRKTPRARSPNAYEKMPKVKEGVSTRGTG
jgi:hypothetical protein